MAGELALAFEPADAQSRILVVPALFDEASKLRRFTVEVMRRLAAAGVASVLPDLPGCNESLQPLLRQTPADWQRAMAEAARHFGCTHLLAIRGGALAAPQDMAGWHYAPVTGASQLRQMLRARILASREAGREETQESLMALGREQGLELAGYQLGPDFLADFATLVAPPSPHIAVVTQGQIGGSGLWLRAEPAEDAGQAEALAGTILHTLAQAEAA